jgi:hypothetical protein
VACVGALSSEALRNLRLTPARARRRSQALGKPRPQRVCAKCGAGGVGLLGIVVRATTFVARLAIIRISRQTRSAEVKLRFPKDIIMCLAAFRKLSRPSSEGWLHLAWRFVDDTPPSSRLTAVSMQERIRNSASRSRRAECTGFYAPQACLRTFSRTVFRNAGSRKASCPTAVAPSRRRLRP